MSAFPYVAIEEFSSVYLTGNHSSRVFGEVLITYTPVASVSAYVADAYLQTISSGSSVSPVSASVADATLETVVASPILTFSIGSLTYSGVAIGSSGEMSFTITNTGDAGLTITSVTPSGDFTVASITES